MDPRDIEDQMERWLGEYRRQIRAECAARCQLAIKPAHDRPMKRPGGKPP